MDRPTIKDCFEYCNNMEQSVAFYNHFESIDWLVGKKGNAKPMVNWRSALTNWVKRSKPKQSNVEIAVSNQSTSIVDLLWVRMTEAFGHKWVSGFGPRPSVPWINLIGSLPKEKVAHGLKMMPKRAKVDKWPPDLLEFNELCQSYRPPFKALKHFPSYQEKLQQREAVEHIRIKEITRIRGIIT